MLTFEQTNYLLTLPKYIVKDGNQEHAIALNLDLQYEYRIMLQASDNEQEYNFLLKISRGRKFTLKLSLHCQDNDSKDCIARIDYGGIHTNPEIISSTLPQQFHPYAGQVLNEPHLHYNINGYKISAWALPLSAINFTPNELTLSDFKINFAEAIHGFMSLINLKSTIMINETARLFS